MIDTTAQNALKNSMYNFIGFLLPIFILIIFTPIIISYLGVKTYGIYIFLNTILTFLGLLDLGIGVATSKHVVEYYSTNQSDKLKKLLYSMNSIYLIQAFIYLFICIIIGIILQTFFLKSTIEVNYLVLLIIIGFTGFISSLFANFINTFGFIQRYDLYLKISMTFLLLSNISMLTLSIRGYKLVPILMAQLLITLVGGFTYFIISKKFFPVMKLTYTWDKLEIIKNYKFALPVAFNNLANSSLIHFDKMLIPIFLGGAPLTYYSVPGSVATKISSISGTFSSLLFPIAVNLHALNDTEKIRRVYIRSVRLIAILSSAIALSTIFTADKILLYWLGKDFMDQSVNVLILLVLTNFVLAIFNPLSNLLIAMGKIRFITIGSFVMAIINIIALFILLPRYGINGAAISYLVSVFFIFIMFHRAEKKFFGIKKNIHFKLILKIILTAIPFYILIKFIFYPLITSFLILAIIGPFSVLLYLGLYKLFGFVEKEDWNDFKLFMSKVLIKLKK